MMLKRCSSLIMMERGQKYADKTLILRFCCFSLFISLDELLNTLRNDHGHSFCRCNQSDYGECNSEDCFCDTSECENYQPRHPGVPWGNFWE